MFPEPVWNEDAGIRPSYRSVHGIHIGIYSAFRDNLGQTAILSLPVIHILYVFSGKGRAVKEPRCRIKEDLSVAGPAVSLPCRAVRRDIQEIALSGPDRTLHEPVEQAI